MRRSDRGHAAYGTIRRMGKLTSLGFAALLGGLVFGSGSCSDGRHSLGTLRDNQHTFLEGQHWIDRSCTKGEGYANCCERRSDFCLDFHDYEVHDVQTRGDRFAILMHVDDAFLLVLSDDRGQTWRQVFIGFLLNTPVYVSASLFLTDDGRVYLMAQSSEVGALGQKYLRIRPFRVNLETGEATLASDNFLLNPVASAQDGNTFVGVSFGSDDIRLPRKCIATVNRWTPGSDIAYESVTIDENQPCYDARVHDSTDGVHFQALETAGDACLLSYDAGQHTGSQSCLGSASWPRGTNGTETVTSFIHERDRVLRFYQDGDSVRVVSPVLGRTPLLVDTGLLRTDEASSRRKRYPGVVPIVDADGSNPRLIGVRKDQTLERMFLPPSPCTGSRATCFDPDSAAPNPASYGDMLWAEPIGNDDYLVVYVHDIAPGINQYKAIYTASIEHATFAPYTPPASHVDAGIDSGSPFSALPTANEGGLLGRYCARVIGCQQGAYGRWIYDCIGKYMSKPSARLLPALLEADATTGCTDKVKDYTWLDCKLDQYCSHDGGVIVPDPPDDTCSGTTELACDGGTTSQCNAGHLTVSRCDLAGLTCDVSVPIRPGVPLGCVNPVDSSDSKGYDEPVCDGDYAIWYLAGPKYVNCKELGLSTCSAGRCVP